MIYSAFSPKISFQAQACQSSHNDLADQDTCQIGMDAETGYTENQAKELDGLADYSNKKSLAVFAQSIDNAV